MKGELQWDMIILIGSVFIILLVIFFDVNYRRCPNCKKKLALIKINEEKRSDSSRFEWECKYCGYTQWDDWPDWPL